MANRRFLKAESQTIYSLALIFGMLINSRELLAFEIQNTTCSDKFLSSDSSWIPLSDTDEMNVKKHDNIIRDKFFPINKIQVSNRILYVGTYGGDLKAVSYNAIRNKLKFSPFYTVFLEGIISDQNKAAGLVAQYTLPNVTHTIKLIGNCSSPDYIIISIDGPAKNKYPMVLSNLR
jgi:hypothetical protein